MIRSLTLLALAALVAPAASAQSPLFAPLDAPLRAASPWLDALAAEAGVVETALVAADLAALADAEVAMDLFGARHVFAERAVWRRSATDWTWMGARGADTAVLVVRDGRVTGTVWAGGGVVRVRPVADGVHALARLDPSAFPTQDPDIGEKALREAVGRPPAGADAPAPAARAADGAVEIDLLVAYTADLADAALDPLAEIQLSVDIANASFVNSGIAARVVVALAYPTPDAAGDDGTKELDDFIADGDGRFDEVHGLREAVGADVVALFGGPARDYDYCGVAPALAVEQDAAFTVLAYDCAGSTVTLAHEIGHLVGADHDPYVTDNDVYPYGHGTVNVAGQWLTIMAYPHECSTVGVECASVPYWSSPTVTYDDTTAPEADGPTGDAAVRDNARVWRERAAIVAAFRAPATPPAAQVGPAELAVSMAPGETVTRSLEIANTAASGAADLSWRITPRSLHADGVRLGTPCASGASIGQRQDPTGYRDYPAMSGTYGQSFTAPCVGVVREVAPTLDLGYANPLTLVGTVRLVEGDGVTGRELSTAAAAYEPPPPSGITPLPASFDPMPAVAEGAAYTWLFDHTSGDIRMPVNSRDLYAGGGLYYGAAGETPTAEPGYDLLFTVSFDPPQAWYAFSGTSGTVAAGASGGLEVTFDATGLAPGTYALDLALQANDPTSMTTTIPVSLTVLPVSSAADPASEATWLGLPRPNPSAGAAVVPYRLAAPGHARLSVVDLLGREVAVLADGPHAAGEARASVPAGLAPGVYVVRLVAGDTAQTRRAVVAR